MEKSILDNDYFLFNDNNEYVTMENLIKSINPYFAVTNYDKDNMIAEIQEKIKQPIMTDIETWKEYYLLVNKDKLNFEEVK